MPSQEELTEWSRTARVTEIAHRRCGRFEQADLIRRQADLAEAGVDISVNCCQYLDRGVSGPIEAYRFEGMLIFNQKPGIAWCLPPDLVFDVWVDCLRFLKMRSTDLEEFARQLRIEERSGAL